jgi:hypothetical protein
MAMTSLHVAVLGQEMETVETIDIVLQDKEESQKLIKIDQLDKLGNTALSYAISTASTPIVRAWSSLGNRSTVIRDLRVRKIIILQMSSLAAW